MLPAVKREARNNAKGGNRMKTIQRYNHWKAMLAAACLAGAVSASAQTVVPDNGPFAGGNVVTVTNGSFGTVTNVVLGAPSIGSAIPIASGPNWFTIAMPPATSAGPVDLLLQADIGETTLANAYTYNPAGAITGYEQTNAWLNIGSMNGPVYALARDGTNLYAGGAFVLASGGTRNNIAQQEGTNWVSMAGGMNGFVHALVHDGTDLYAGGAFTTAGGESANYVAAWNGTTWTNLGSGLNGTVKTLFLDGTHLYAGGNFTTAGGADANYVARWDGNAWTNLGTGMNGEVRTLLKVGSTLYAGGNFSSADGYAASHLAVWNGTTWSNVPGGIMNQPVNALAHDGSNLYVGGEFHRVGVSVIYDLAQWDGTVWTNLATSINFVRALQVVGSDLYVGGDFSSVDGNGNARHIAKWNGQSWTNIGQGMNASVYAIIADDSFVYAGGSYTEADGKPSDRLATTQYQVPSGVEPSSGSRAGGFTVTIIGNHLGNGTDVTNVTICGVAAEIVSQSATQIVVTAGASAVAGLGDVVVQSVSFGETVRADAFTYLGKGLRVLGANDAIVGNGEAPSAAKGTQLPSTQASVAVEQVFRIENTGTGALAIDRADVEGAEFSVEGLPASVAVGGASNFTVRFEAAAPGVFTGTVAVVSDADGPATNYVLNLRGNVYTQSASDGPFEGGNTLTITNGLFGNITNVWIDGVGMAEIVGSGPDWFTIILPPGATNGPVDFIAQTSDNGDVRMPNAYSYNVAPQIGWSRTDTDAWQEVQRYPRIIHNAAAATWNDALYVMGGNDSVANANVTNVYRMSACGAWEQVAGLPDIRQLGSAAVFQDALYFVGGYSASSRTNVYRYDGTNWTQVRGLPAARHYGGVAVLGDHLYYVGGRNGTTYMTTVYRFDGTNWTTATSLPAARAGFGCAVYDGKIHVVGGHSGSAATTNVYVYDGASWTQTAGLPLATDGHGAAVYDGRLFTVGGFNRTQSFAYDGTSWTVEPGLPAQRPWVAAASFGDHIYAVGGNLSGSQFNVYRYPSLDEHAGVFPPAISYTGGYPVVISGSNLTDPDDPADLLSVTLCGVPVASVQSAGATQIVVMAAAGASQRGDVVVRSARYGTATGSNIFHYAPWTELDFDFGAADWQSTNISMVGEAYWPDSTTWNTKRLRLTSSVTSQRGNGWITSHRINPSRDWVASWRCSMSYPNPADNPADGTSFNIHTNGVDYHPTLNEQLGNNEAAVLTVNVHMDSATWRGLRVFANGSQLGAARMDGLRIDRTDEYPIAVTARYDSVRCELHVSLHQPATDLGTNMVFKIDLGEAIGEEAIGMFGFSGRTGSRGQNNDVREFNIQADMGEAEIAVLDAEGVSVPSGTTVDYGAIPFGTVTTRTFAVTNRGLYALAIEQAELTEPTDFAVEGLPTVVEGGTASNFTVTLNATNVGNAAATLTLTPAVLAPYVLHFGATVEALPPVVGPVTVWRATNQVLKLPDFMLLTNAVDPQASAMSLSWVSVASTNGGSVALEGRWITYEPPPGDDTPDAFNFRVRNAYGAETEGTAEVLVMVPTHGDGTLNVSDMQTIGQDVHVRFAGIPGRTYDVQVTTNMAEGIWTKVGESITIGALGYVDFVEENAPPGNRYYRTARPE
jgi:N-acetylneuraminic acid mutarotase